MNYLGIEDSVLREQEALITAKEIVQQPLLWDKIYTILESMEDKLLPFLNEAYETVDSIILTGAGTSGFIGVALEGIFLKASGLFTMSVSTTDLITHPYNYLNSRKAVLLVSFARSGNSPESMSTLRLVDQISAKCMHLIITCNAGGEIVSYATKNPKLIILLPPESNDQGLAMTSSFTGMFLTGLLAAKIQELKAAKHQVKLLCRYGEKVLKDSLPLIKFVAGKDFKRVVFLGAGPLYGTAMESQLKVQELTNGKIVCKYDSFLGFRHGPKAVIDETTLIVYLFSNVEYVNKYEKDLIASMHKGRKVLLEIGVAENTRFNAGVEPAIIFSDNGTRLDEEFLAICAVLPAQLIAFFKSLNLKLKPDSPAEDGTISRVVEGVIIYPFVN